MQIILVRHGQTYNNASHTIDTAMPGAVLTEEGWQQANDVVPALVALQPTSIWASTLKRTQQTATPLATRLGMEITVHDGLREIEAGSFEGSNTEADYRAYSQTIGKWLFEDKSVRMGGGVTGQEVLDRFDAAVRQMEEQGEERPAVFAHGGMIAYWVGARTGSTSEGLELPLRNTGIVQVSGTLDTGFRLDAWMEKRISS